MTPELAELRRELHRLADPSGREARTAAFLRERLSTLSPDALIGDVGGQGVMASFRGETPGPSILFRAELDALPIDETIDVAWGSARPGTSHKCGHDGHMALLLGLAGRLSASRPPVGDVHLLFQPAEETGEGAEAVLADPAFRGRAVDVAIALHNLPGFPEGTVVLRDDVFAWTSIGAAVHLEGHESHASQPELGRSPAPALAQLILDLQRWATSHRTGPSTEALTVTHARLGAPAFGTSPGRAVVFATFRADNEEAMSRFRSDLERRATELAEGDGLQVLLEWHEAFPLTRSDAGINRVIETAARSEGLDVLRPDGPFRWSEDFGHFTARYRGALFGLGSGTDTPPLHHPEYDFPDSLLQTGVNLLDRIARTLPGDGS